MADHNKVIFKEKRPIKNSSDEKSISPSKKHKGKEPNCSTDPDDWRPQDGPHPSD